MTSRKAILSLAVLLFATSPLALPQGTYTQIDFPGAVYTVALGIDRAGDVVGGYANADSSNHGFLLSSGVYTTIDDPGVPGAYAWGINDLGQIVGNNGSSLSYLYDVQTQTFTNISFPNPQAYTLALSINNAGTIVGNLQLNGSCCIGFELRNGSHRIVARSGSTDTQLFGINNMGVAVGIDLVGPNGYDFFYVQGRFQPIRIPAKFPTADGINDAGSVVGAYRPSPKSSSYQGFLYQGSAFQEVAFPGSTTGFASGINNSGVIVGSFTNPDLSSHGFIWTPAAPVGKK